MTQNRNPRLRGDPPPLRGPLSPAGPPPSGGPPPQNGPLPPAGPPPSRGPLPQSGPLPPDDEPDEAEYDEFWDDLDEPPEASLPLTARLRRLPPFLVILSVASVVSVAFLALSVMQRSIEIPVLIAAAVVTGIVFATDAVALGRGTYGAAEDGRSGRSLLLALVGGVAAVIAGLSFGAAVVMLFLYL
jgi:hypothetical protein